MARDGSRLRLAAASAGSAVTAAAALGLRDPLASMASYTAALMALNQIAPPLLLAAFEQARGREAERGRHRVVSASWSGVTAALFDPVAAFMGFGALSIAVSLPGLLDPTLAGALYAAPLGALEMATGLMIWGQVMPATRRVRSDWRVALLVWAATVPMTVVAAVWMMSPDVIYTPYLDVICRWNVPPLVDQKWAGFVMLLAGMPLQLAAAWLLLGLSSPHFRAPSET